MADAFSFDIVSEVNLQEVDNAVNQTRKEIAQRYDFKGSRSTIALDVKGKTITLLSDDEFKIRSVVDILQTKLIKRGVPVKALAYSPTEPAAAGMVRQEITLRVGISTEDARRIVKLIKEMKLRVQVQIMEDQIRVTGKAKDDLQSVITMIRKADLDFAVQFTNYR